MCTLRDVVIFFAGAEFFHTLNHLLLPYMMQLPVDLNFMQLTETLNWWSVGINGVITVLLLWWATKLKKK